MRSSEELARRALRGLVVLSFLLAGGPLCAQISVTGGPQAVVWPSNCATTVLFTNNTKLPLGALWIGINNDGINNAPEVATIAVNDGSLTKIWDVDDNEDFDNDDGSEGDTVDSTPLGLASGWHR